VTISMKSIREAYGEALVELGKENNNVVVLDADVSSSTRSILFNKAYPERFFNIGIAEGNMTAIAAGMAADGKIPFVNTFAFLLALRAADPIRSLIAYNKLNVKLVGAYGGFSDSYDGASHQSIEDVSIMRAIPNIAVIVVADEYETKKAVFEAASFDGPVYLRLSRAEIPALYSEQMDFKIGKGIVVKEGKDVSIIANGCMVEKSVQAAKILQEQGIDAEVIDMHTVKPIDEELILSSGTKTKAIVTVEEHSVIGGLGSAVSEVLSRKMPLPQELIGIQDLFGESGDYEQLLEKYSLDSTAIINAALKVLTRKKIS
jgi:transketolase